VLGLDYGEWFISSSWGMATDSSGALYILSSPMAAANRVTKLSADGRTILWQEDLGLTPQSGQGVQGPMAVDSNGGVYFVLQRNPIDTSVLVAKLSADGSGVAWVAPVGPFLALEYFAAIAVDSQGRVYVAGIHDAVHHLSGVVRLNAAGTAVEYTAQVAGTVTAIAVDASGAAFVAGYVPPEDVDYAPVTPFIARLAPDGSAGFYSTLLPKSNSYDTEVVVDAKGNGAAAYGTSTYMAVLQGFDSTGAVTFSKNIPGPWPQGLAMDADGNAYVTGSTNSTGQLYPVMNSLATCGAAFLSVFAPDGSLLEGTYIPVYLPFRGPAVATGPNSTVFLVALADASVTPTEAGPFPAGRVGSAFLWHLSPSATAQVFPLACLGNAASFGTGPIAPGEIVSLFGNGLGPQQGVQTSATLQTPFPTQAAGVEVTFDGTPAPLLWVQDAQINAVVPWSLTPGQSTRICVSYNDVKLNCLAWPVAQTAPGVFTVDGTYAAAVNQDGTVNSAAHPAPVGSIVAVWATGLGPITPAQADGTLVDLPLPSNTLLPVGVRAPTPIFNSCFPGDRPGCPYTPPYIDFDVTYAGPAPYMVAGVTQINFQVVDYAPAGYYQTGPITVALPATSSQGFQIHYVAGQ
jgi:uncharacterized protein (TIGR03437 family)